MSEVGKILLDEIKLLNSGKADVQKSRVVVDLCSQLIYEKRIEQEKDVLKEKVRLWNRLGKDK